MLGQLTNTLVVFFVVIDPIGLAVIFAMLSLDCSAEERRRMAYRGTALAAGILLLFFFLGDGLLKILGIGVPAFRIAGGLLLFLLALDMVLARPSGLRSTTQSEEQEAHARHDISVFPLAFPLIAGPGALTTVLLMAADEGSVALSLGMLTIIVAVLLLTLALLLLAGPVRRLLGETGANVVSRLLGVILAALAVQYVVDGIHGAFPAMDV